jgi:hypothetical protein
MVSTISERSTTEPRSRAGTTKTRSRGRTAESRRTTKGKPPNAAASKSKSKRIRIHDNGGRPFTVQVSDSLSSKRSHPKRSDAQVLRDRIVSVYSTTDGALVQTYTASRLFVPKGYLADEDPSLHMKYPRNPSFDGNSLLLEIDHATHRYVFIGWEVYEFTSDGPIEKYFSLVGNNDVPYPIAVTGKYVYFMLDKRRVPLKKMPQDITDADLLDAYRLFYYDHGLERIATRVQKVHVVHERHRSVRSRNHKR